ncbi:MAG: UDP-glucose 4-epimerase GalE [Candidatus Margulisbacteria bacterium]|nr:UDP-glucose 4-epimerase GalE [Candidatus Margulisiibacteriota bacterium]
MKNILVTGGAGYIGSIAVEELLKVGYQVVVLDNLSEGHRQAIPENVPFYHGNVGDKILLQKIFSEQKIDCVMHFAALALVGESVKYPEKYRENNVLQTLILLDTMVENKILNFIFSSSCAIFGEPSQIPMKEDDPKNPINPYGTNKLEVEKNLKELNKKHGLKACALRYFNAAGATEKCGEDRKVETHLIPLVLDTALDKRKSIHIFGTDYPTPDGTCIRDYIHVLDLIQAHILAIDYLKNNELGFFNLGNGQGYSVKEVIETSREITGHAIPAEEKPRRPGDPARLVGSAELAKKKLGWEPKYPQLDKIIESAWEWRQQHPKGYSK